MHELLSCQLKQCTKVHVAEASVLVPRILPHDHGQADWPCHLNVLNVQPSWTAIYLGHHAHGVIAHALDSVHHDPEPDLIQLPTADYICSKTWNEIDVAKGTVFTILA
jgi:hypothetical protein